MLADNNSPFAAVAFEQVHRDGQRMAVVAARARYALSPDGSLARSTEPEIVLSDVYDGPPHNAPLLRASDLMPFRPFADVTVLAQAHAPDNAARAAWNVGVKIDDRAAVLRVNGPREWRPESGPGGERFVLGPAKPSLVAPIDYRAAAGGRAIGDPKGWAEPRNPIGPGLIDDKYTSTRHSYAAPTIESPDAPIVDPLARPEPQGFGPIAPSWAQRLRFAGTYDEEWRERRHPRLPADFDYRFHQVAHPSLVQPGYLRAGARISLGRLAPGDAPIEFRIPDEEPYAIFKWIDGREVVAAMNRDGLHVDMRGPPPWRVDVAFRVWIEVCPRFLKADLGFTDAVGAATLPGCGEFGLMEGARA